MARPACQLKNAPGAKLSVPVFADIKAWNLGDLVLARASLAAERRTTLGGIAIPSPVAVTLRGRCAGLVVVTLRGLRPLLTSLVVLSPMSCPRMSWTALELACS